MIFSFCNWIFRCGDGNSYSLGFGNSYALGPGNSYSLGSGNSYAFGLWELIFALGFGQEGGPGGPRGPKGTCNTLRLVGRKLLSNIIAAEIIFLAAVIVFLAAVIRFLAAVIGFLAAVIGRAVDRAEVDRAVDLARTLLSGAQGPGPRARDPIGP